MAHILRGVTLSYPNLFVPKMPPNPRPGQKARYNCMALIPHDLDIKELQAFCYNMLKEKFGDNVDKLLEAGFANQPNGLKWPFRKDNVKRDGGKRFDETKYKCFITPWSENQPGLVDRYAGPDGKPLKIMQPVNDRFYAGSVVNLSVNPFVYDNSGNRGVGMGLVNLQHWADGERLDNRVNAEDEFQAETRPAVDLAAVGTGSGAPDAGGAVDGASAGPRGAKLNDLFA